MTRETTRRLVNEELIRAKAFTRDRNWVEAWAALERAHIFSQPAGLPHLRVHWRMWLLGIRLGNAREILGQIPRMFFSLPSSWWGFAPRGNTGRSNVPAWRPMDIPKDVADRMVD